jgi:hypothetical protein
MTNDRAKEVLKAWNLNHSDEFTVHEFDEAFRMAIKALEQEPFKCEETISKSEALKIINSWRGIDPTAYTHIYSEIDCLPSVNPQEPKTGHWIYDKSIENWKCSECKLIPKTIGYVGSTEFMKKEFRFCNHCGCRMEEVTE